MEILTSRNTIRCLTMDLEGSTPYIPNYNIWSLTYIFNLCLVRYKNSWIQRVTMQSCLLWIFNLFTGSLKWKQIIFQLLFSFKNFSKVLLSCFQLDFYIFVKMINCEDDFCKCIWANIWNSNLNVLFFMLAEIYISKLVEQWSKSFFERMDISKRMSQDRWFFTLGIYPIWMWLVGNLPYGCCKWRWN